jgi:hypothetical protein
VHFGPASNYLWTALIAVAAADRSLDRRSPGVARDKHVVQPV